MSLSANRRYGLSDIQVNILGRMAGGVTLRSVVRWGTTQAFYLGAERVSASSIKALALRGLIRPVPSSQSTQWKTDYELTLAGTTKVRQFRD